MCICCDVRSGYIFNTHCMYIYCTYTVECKSRYSNVKSRNTCTYTALYGVDVYSIFLASSVYMYMCIYCRIEEQIFEFKK